jgi:hypothetical protein
MARACGATAQMRLDRISSTGFERNALERSPLGEVGVRRIHPT